jgi:hypothetical protein
MADSISGNPDKVVSGKLDFVVLLPVPFVRIFTHGSGLGVVVRGIGVEVTQILGGVFADTQVADCIPVERVRRVRWVR